MYIQNVRERKVIPKMPNWVMNELICSFQTQEQFESFKSKINLEGLFNSFIPMPEILEGTQSPNINPDKLIADFNKWVSYWIELTNGVFLNYNILNNIQKISYMNTDLVSEALRRIIWSYYKQKV